jgi:hypothetical protein
MCPDDKLGLTLALYTAQILSASEAAQALLSLAASEGAKLSSPVPGPLALELRSLLYSAQGQELAAADPARYRSILGCCAGEHSGQGSVPNPAERGSS